MQAIYDSQLLPSRGGENPLHWVLLGVSQGAPSEQWLLYDGSDIPFTFPFLQDTELLAMFSVENDKLMIDAKLDK